jgi:hypothetical protein
MPNLPDNNKLCLRELFANFDLVKQPHALRETIALKNGFGFLVKRTKPYVIRTRYTNLETEVGRENYFHDCLMQYLSWRKEEDILGGFKTYKEAFEHHRPTIEQMAQYE